MMASELASVRDQRNITFELCAWGFGNVETFGGGMGHLWRTSQDITDTWHGLLWNIDVNDEVRHLETSSKVSYLTKIISRSDTGRREFKDQKMDGITLMGSSLAKSLL